MFTLTATPVKFCILLVLLVLSSAWELVRLVRARGASSWISRGFHLLMSLVMLAMVPAQLWNPLHQWLGLPVLVVVMALGFVWFAVRCFTSPAGAARRHALGCAGMFAAMVWHLWGMQVHMSHAMTMSSLPAHQMDHSSMDHMGHMPSMGGMSSTGADWMTMATRPGGVMWWFALVGIPIVLALLWSAVRDLSAARHRPERRLEHLAGFAMSFSMAWMSTGLLTPVLGWAAHLSF